jgi:hypothetical protein
LESERLEAVGTAGRVILSEAKDLSRAITHVILSEAKDLSRAIIHLQEDPSLRSG